MNDPIRAAIVAKLKSVPGIGTVQAYQRYSDDYRGLADYYMTGEKLLGWYVHRQSTQEQRVKSQFVEYVEWRIVGFAGWSDADASALAIDDLVDAIRAQFRTDITLGGIVQGLHDIDGKFFGIQQIGTDSVLFAGVLSHQVTLALSTMRTFTYQPERYP